MVVVSSYQQEASFHCIALLVVEGRMDIALLGGMDIETLVDSCCILDLDYIPDADRENLVIPANALLKLALLEATGIPVT